MKILIIFKAPLHFKLLDRVSLLIQTKVAIRLRITNRTKRKRKREVSQAELHLKTVHKNKLQE